MKKEWIATSILCVILLVSGSLGALIMVKEYEAPEKKLYELDGEKFFSMESLEQIEVGYGFDKILVSKSNATDLVIKYSGLLESTSNNSDLDVEFKQNLHDLLITKKSSFKRDKLVLFDFDNMYSDELILKILVPENSSLNLKIKDSEISIKNLSFEVLELETYYQDLVLENIIAKKIVCKTSSGDAKLINIEGDSLNFDTYSGDLDLRNANFNNLNLKSSSSDFDLEDIKSKNMFFETYSGDIEINQINFDSLTGKSSSGDFEITSNTLGNLDLKTYSGTTKLTLGENVSFELLFDTYSGNLENEFPILISEDSNLKMRGIVGDQKTSKKVLIKSSSGNLIIEKN